MLHSWKKYKENIRMRYAIPIIVSLAFLPAFLLLPDPNRNTVKFDTVTVSAEVADEVLERAKGLSGREGLGEKEGMLFKFDEYGFYYFWMKDMLFPIDMIWIRDNKVVDVTHNAPFPVGDEQPASFSPQEIVNYVLEVNAGFAREHGIQEGDMVTIIDN